MSKVDEALVEIDAALADIALPLEGLEDYLALDLGPEAKAIVQQVHDQYAQRQAFLVAAKTWLETLVADGYPALPVYDVSLTVMADLEAQQASIAAALAKFRVQAASELGLVSGVPEPR
jgi:hypothetical protein